MPDSVKDFSGKLSSLVFLYEKAKLAIVALGTYNQDNEEHIGPHNEMRNALSHIIGMIKNQDNIEVCNGELRAAQAHLRRAGCDAYELLCSHLIEYIHSLLFKFDHDDIAIPFPFYYTEIRPKIIDIQDKIKEIRVDKEVEPNYRGDLFEHFSEQSELLIGYVKVVNNHIPVIMEIKRKRRKNKLRDYLIGGLIGFVISGLFFILSR